MKEDGYELLVDKMSLASRRLLSIVGYVEACMVLTRLRGESAGRELDWLLSESRVEIFPVDNSQGKLARDALLRFGKGRHSAKLNFGDCFSYALAKQLGQPLLYVGNDFSQTDIVSA